VQHEVALLPFLVETGQNKLPIQMHHTDTGRSAALTP
jgi:hypothetical protein